MVKFNNKGEVYNTSIGGILTIIMSLGIFAYTGYRINVLINKLETNISSVLQAVDPTSIG
jgi:hypothetical protein